MTARLDTMNFIRVHRSILINIERVREMRRKSGGDFDVFLKDGSHFTSGRSYRTNLQALLESGF
ncbi:MAG: LytTR family DNA-binding domain-containing protein [bacterium]